MTGDQLRYRIVEFLLPNPETEPHEIAVDAQGNGWITQRTGGKLGRLDVQTLEYKEFDPPQAATKTVRLNGIVSAPGGGQLWFVDGGPNRRWLSYDPAAEKFEVFELPKLKNGSASGNTMRYHPDGSIWLCSLEANQISGWEPWIAACSIFTPAKSKPSPRAKNCPTRRCNRWLSPRIRPI